MRNLAETFTLLIEGLKKTIAPFPYTPQPRFAFQAFIWHRLWSISKRFARLYTRWKNGTLPKPRAPGPVAPRAAQPSDASPSAASPGAASPGAASPGATSAAATSPGATSPTSASPAAASPPAPEPPKKRHLPQGRMWLIKYMQETAFAGSQLRHLIATTPELHEFLKAAPQARRLLNPLCRMLGVNFDAPYGVPLVFAPPEAPAPPPPELKEPEPKEPEPAAPTPAPPQAGLRPLPANTALPGGIAPAASKFFSPA